MTLMTIKIIATTTLLDKWTNLILILCLCLLLLLLGGFKRPSPLSHRPEQSLSFDFCDNRAVQRNFRPKRGKSELFGLRTV